jgi:methionyl-tRNA formyltransferase
MRIVLIATSEYAMPTFEALVGSRHDLVGVVTQPDSPAGRGRHLTPTPIATVAEAAKIPTLKPETLRNTATQQQILSLRPDLIVVIAYGKLIPRELIDAPNYKCVNIHPSLLPKYRGASPVQWALLNGDTVTGVTTMYITEEMDAGDILMQTESPVQPHETSLDLYTRLFHEGAELLLQTVDGLENGTLTPRPQASDQVTFAPLLEKSDGVILWSLPAQQIINRVRGLQPWPSAYSTLHGKVLKVFRAEIPDDRSVPEDSTPGQIIEITRSLHVVTGDGRLCLTDLQLAGKRRMLSEEFLRGYTIDIGEILK